MTDVNTEYINYDKADVTIGSILRKHTHSIDTDAGTVEWTPIDSSYGAACPMCGWIPKKIRKKVEAAILFSIATLLVSFVITASIRLSSKGSSHKSFDSVPSLWGDDDYDDIYSNSTYLNGTNYDDIYKSYDDYND